jgi:diguanylate cyclase (GGDEF)-like protein
MHKVQNGESVMGRGSSVSIRLSDDGISRRHARIMVRGSDVTIEDLGSANGMFINGVRVPSSPLKDGDQIQLGGTTILKFTYHDSLEEDFQRQMYDAALRDALTKAFNKKHFMDRLGTEVAYARRHNTPLALVMFDVDFFKKVNDTYGHLAGDYVLQLLAQVAQHALRAEDMFARYGGEEFAVLCRGTNLEDASIIAERLRAQVEHTQFVFENTNIPITISAGVAAFPNVPAQSPVELIAASDEALYAAKRGGRNRVVTKTS